MLSLNKKLQKIGDKNTLEKQKIEEEIKRIDKEMNYNCKKCNKKISSHNKDWHNGMCDDCFDETYSK